VIRILVRYFIWFFFYLFSDAGDLVITSVSVKLMWTSATTNKNYNVKKKSIFTFLIQEML